MKRNKLKYALLAFALSLLSASSTAAQQCAQPAPLPQPWGARTSFAQGDSGEGKVFDPKAGYVEDFGGVVWPHQVWFGFVGELNKESYARGYYREVRNWDLCGNWYRQYRVKCQECVFQTGDESGGFLTVVGMDVVATFMKRSGGWVPVPDVDNHFKLDYGGLSERHVSGNGGSRFEFSVHDGGIYKKVGGGEFRYAELNCPFRLNTGTWVELGFTQVESAPMSLKYAVFHIWNDANPANLNPTFSNWFAFPMLTW